MSNKQVAPGGQKREGAPISSCSDTGSFVQAEALLQEGLIESRYLTVLKVCCNCSRQAVTMICFATSHIPSKLEYCPTYGCQAPN